jgi:rhodanese-related sulfurtransferase
MRLLLRILFLGLASLILGISMNQIHPGGIRWPLLHTALWETTGRDTSNTIQAHQAFFHFMEKTAVFIDVRSEESHLLDHIPGSLSIPYESYFLRIQEYQPEPDTALYIIYEFSPDGFQARMISRHLSQSGYDRVYWLQGGLSEWLEMDLPVFHREEL